MTGHTGAHHCQLQLPVVERVDHQGDQGWHHAVQPLSTAGGYKMRGVKSKLNYVAFIFLCLMKFPYLCNTLLHRN